MFEGAGRHKLALADVCLLWMMLASCGTLQLAITIVSSLWQELFGYGGYLQALVHFS